MPRSRRPRLELDLNADPEVDATRRCCHTSGSGRCRMHFYPGLVSGHHHHYCGAHGTDQIVWMRALRVLSAAERNRAVLVFCMGHRDIFPPELLERVCSGLMVRRRELVRFTPPRHDLRREVRATGTMANPIDLRE